MRDKVQRGAVFKWESREPDRIERGALRVAEGERPCDDGSSFCEKCENRCIGGCIASDRTVAPGIVREQARTRHPER